MWRVRGWGKGCAEERLQEAPNLEGVDLRQLYLRPTMNPAIASPTSPGQTGINSCPRQIARTSPALPEHPRPLHKPVQKNRGGEKQLQRYKRTHFTSFARTNLCNSSSGAGTRTTSAGAPPTARQFSE